VTAIACVPFLAVLSRRCAVIRLLLALAVVAIPCPAGSAQEPRYRIEAADHQTVTATLTYEVRTTKFTVRRWMAFLPEPPNLPSQAVTRVKADPMGQVVSEKSPIARKVRFVDVKVTNPAPGKKLTLKLEVEATLRTRKLVPLAPGEAPPKVAALTLVEQKYYTSATPQVDHAAKEFRDWLGRKELRAKDGEQPLDLAARVLTVLRADFTYHFDPREDKRASLVCERKSTDCGGLANLLVGVMRANGVPARLLVGRMAKPRAEGSEPGDTGYDQPHVRAEVYVAGVGWVPIDPAEASRAKDVPVADFIGADAGDLLVLHADTDLRLPYPDEERTANLLQITPNVWTFGQGQFDVTLGPSGWDVKTTPAKK
jgi:transglutaminase-like putative cysteine protease